MKWFEGIFERLETGTEDWEWRLKVSKSTSNKDNQSREGENFFPSQNIVDKTKTDQKAYQENLNLSIYRAEQTGVDFDSKFP